MLFEYLNGVLYDLLLAQMFSPFQIYFSVMLLYFYPSFLMVFEIRLFFFISFKQSSVIFEASFIDAYKLLNAKILVLDCGIELYKGGCIKCLA